MLKAIVSYSKKIPVPESEYSSQGYSLSLETEIPETDPKAIQARLSQTFQLVKNQVEQELANGKTKVAPVPDVPENQVPLAPPTTDKASNKQVKYLTDLARDRGISITELNTRARELYGVTTIYDLSKKDASKLVDALKHYQRKAA